ncbi:uncharacterized protein EAF02_006734 [Botrytis sinoallii]|uniref:uncharacterized protein n=1 Tax=Botrytis sinoallii TaxID=1463999 RepID=UPI001901F2DD|nr:uncharacterized protein EAF02_006734 [Botrytis sinoallii]KAF7880843.1 hypothetical protein EAF02_006734 [Botrytis sinoallii]
MFHSSKSSKVTLHKKLFAPVSITSALGSGSSTEPKATIPVLLPAESLLETEVQSEVQIETQEQDIDTQAEHKVVANSIQVLPPSPPRSPFYPSSSSHQSSHQSSTHRRNMSSTSTTTTQFGSPPPSYTPFVTNSLPPQAYPYHVQNQYVQANGYRYPNGNMYSNGFSAGNQHVNAPLNHQLIHRTGFASPSPSPSPGLQLPDLVDEVLRLRDRLNLLEGGALAIPGERGRSTGRERDRRGDVENDEERKDKKAKEVERETREAKERWEEIERCGLGYEDFLDEFFGNDYSDWKIEKFNFEEEIEGRLQMELGGVKLVDEVCDEEEKSGDEYEDEEEEEGKEEEEEEEETDSEEDEDNESESEEESSKEQSAEEENTPKPEDTITLLPSVFVDERTKSRLHPSYSSSSSTFSAYFPRSSAPSPPRYNQQKFREIPLKSTPVAPNPPRIIQRQPDPLLPEFGCHYFVDAGSIQNITVIYPVTSLPQSMDDLEEEKEVIRCVLEGWNRGNIDKYGHRPSKKAYAAIIYPDPQAPLPRKKLRVALSFTPIYPPTPSSISSVPTTQTPTNPEDITTDTSIYISTTNGCTSFSLSNNNGVMDHTKYKVKYGNLDVHERHDGILEVGRLRGALGCEVFGKKGGEGREGKGDERGEGDGTENKIGDEEEYWENEEIEDEWKDDSHDVGWGDDKKGYELGLENGKEIEGGWI